MTSLLTTVQQIKTVTHDKTQQFNILNALASRFDINAPQAVDDEPAQTVRHAILQFEKRGNTGFDCGWVTATFPDKHVSDYELIADESDDYFDVLTYNDGGVRFTLADYPINVQSTGMKAFVMSQVLDIITTPVAYHLVTVYD